MSEKKILKVRKIVECASAPFKGSELAAGLDLKSAENFTVRAHDRGLISTGLTMQLPTGTFGRISPRSGLAARHGLDVGGGIIDEDYRGVVYVILFNHTSEDFVIHKGDRIAQLIICPYVDVAVKEVQLLDDTTRGEAGLGSTGV